jgi:protein-S-isoprenylcysteine O-methyltransferase Ste14
MRLILFVLAVEAIILGILLSAAGRADLPWCWAVVVTHGVCLSVYVGAMDADLRSERLRPGGPERDRWLRLAQIPLVLLHLVVAGLDLRFGWSGDVPTAVHLAGLMLLALSLLLTAWAVRTNRFFSSVVRIQDDRGHHVVTSGPYRFVRHPGYLGMLGGAFGGAMALGSWWSMLPLAILVLVVAGRAAREDGLLRRSLAGYAEYTQSVRFRLVPGLW